MKNSLHMSLAVDGWQDYARYPTLAFTVHLPMGRSLLFSFERIFERETGEFLDQAVRKVANELKEMGVVVASVIADNAKNIQKGLQLSATNLGFLVMNCWAHTLNLLLKVCSKVDKGENAFMPV